MLDDIERDIAAKGFSEVMSVGLENLCFKDTSEKTGQQRLDEWCQAKGYTYEVFDRKDAQKKMRQWLRFSRQR